MTSGEAAAPDPGTADTGKSTLGCAVGRKR
jgi:hypothetical protein